MNQGKTEEARRTFLKCSEISDENLKDPHAHKSSVTSCLYNLGKLYHEQGHYEVSRIPSALSFPGFWSRLNVSTQRSHHRDTGITKEANMCFMKSLMVKFVWRKPLRNKTDFLTMSFSEQLWLFEKGKYHALLLRLFWSPSLRFMIQDTLLLLSYIRCLRLKNTLCSEYEGSDLM